MRFLRPAGVHWEGEHRPNFPSEGDERCMFTRDLNQFASEVASADRRPVLRETCDISGLELFDRGPVFEGLWLFQ
jgi:hypothetical protein